MNTSPFNPKYQVTPETSTRQIIDWILELKVQRANRQDIQKLQQVLGSRSTIE